MQKGAYIIKTYLKQCVVRLMLLFIIVGAFVCQCKAQNTNIDTQDIYARPGKATDPIPLMPKARIGTLPNGLKYYILKNDQPKDRAYLSLVVNAGAVLEKMTSKNLLIL
ncbi:hypothetical protein AGMMS49921_05130 [Endomicrobiia bacterium]|nr:hypothetical protein AGMMS49921_05130 [Endomicrobiia bacterium]